MRLAAAGRWSALVLFSALMGARSWAAEPPATLAGKAQAVLKTHCHRCHGQDGAVEGGMNFILDRDKLIARKKIVPGKAEQSPLYKRLAAGKMPPAGEQPRPTAADIALLKQWIEAGAPSARPAVQRVLLTEADVHDLILADLDKREKRSRRFTRYFSLAPLANAGAGPDELETYRHALAKLLNSLSWHPRITLPHAIDPAGVVLRIDLRDYLWDANLWNRLVADYPYGVLLDTAVARAVLVATATRLPCVRADWFVANASRAPLYYDLLQIPTNAAELERQLRVDVALDIQQERVARAGFNGSGISRNNRVLERHDAQNGAYWRTYDFEAVPQNLLERDILLPDRRNLFAYPLGPGFGDNSFQHAAGEIIFNLPNGLHGYLLVNANNVRQDKGAQAIVSDPKRPDRAVEAGVSCMACHSRGINFKDDQIRDHVAKNRKAFSRADAELIRALYVPKEKMRSLMEEDAERFKKAVEKTGNRVDRAEVIMSMTLRYEADVDLPALAAEAGLKPEQLLPRLAASENLARNLGALKLPGATVARQVVVQSFADLARELHLGTPLQAGATGQSLPDNTGEIDPLEAQSSPANAAAFSPDGRYAAFASADKTVRIWDVEAGRDLRRCIGHTASVWSVAFSPDGTRLLSGSKDGTVRLWDVATGRELRKFEGHADLVTSVAFAPDGRHALSAGYDHEVFLWDLGTDKPLTTFTFGGSAKYINHVAFAPDGKRALVCAERTVYVIDAATGKVLRSLQGHTHSVVSAAFAPDGKHILSGGDDRTLRLWDAATGKQVRVFSGHDSWVKSVAFSPDGRLLLSGSSDTTVRLWDVASGKELKAFRKHTEPIVAATFTGGGRRTLSVSRDAAVHPWRLPPVSPAPIESPAPVEVGSSYRTHPVGGTVGSLLVSPDRQWVYYLNVTDGTLNRLNPRQTRVDLSLRLAEGTNGLARTRDGKTLVAVAPVAVTKAGNTDTSCRVQLIDAATLTLRKSFRVENTTPYDVAITDDGLIFVSAGADNAATVTVIDANKGGVVGRWGGLYWRSFLQLSPDQRRLYYATQAPAEVSPLGTLEAVVVAGKLKGSPQVYRARLPAEHTVHGEFVLSPDGRFLLCKNGTVLKLSAGDPEDMSFQTSLGAFTAATGDVEAKAVFVVTRDRWLKVYSYPDFKLTARHQLDLIPYQVASDGLRLYVAGLDPRSLLDNPKARGHGEIHIYDVKRAKKN